MVPTRSALDYMIRTLRLKDSQGCSGYGSSDHP